MHLSSCDTIVDSSYVVLECVLHCLALHIRTYASSYRLKVKILYVVLFKLYRPVTSSTELTCVTEPWPFASEGEGSPQLSVTLVVNGTALTFPSVVYQYSWSSTPQVSA